MNRFDETPLSRRLLLKSAVLSSSISTLAVASSQQKKSANEERFQIWDSHVHLSTFSGNTPEKKVDSLLEFADRMGIARIITFMGWPWAHKPSPEQIRQENDQVLQALRHAPDRLLGYVYLNPADVDGSLTELRRCVADGPMVGIKLWVAERCNAKTIEPIFNLATDLKAVVYQHTWLKSTGNLPTESTPQDVVEIAKRHPECKFICGHTGGTWELGLRVMKKAPENIAMEIAGTDPTAGITERAVAILGADRVIYGSDAQGRSLSTQLAKILGAEISDDDKSKILGGNIQALLRPIMKSKGMVTG